jgi:hypothetical protein
MWSLKVGHTFFFVQEEKFIFIGTIETRTAGVPRWSADGRGINVCSLGEYYDVMREL